MPEPGHADHHPARLRIVRALSLVEDAVYVALGVLLTIAALALLFTACRIVFQFWHSGQLIQPVVSLLDHILLTLLVIELLYTVQVSFREHGLLAEPFLVVALIATIRRLLVLTAQVSELPERGEVVFRHAMIELGLLTVMIIVLVGSLIALQRHSKLSPAEE